MGDINELIVSIDEFMNAFPDKRRELVEEVGEKIHAEVRRGIERETKKKTGNYLKACEKHIGSGGGYAAVRNNHAIAPHAHLIENGHDIKRGGRVVGFVPGKHIYRNAMYKQEYELLEMSERMMDDIVGEVFD